MPLTLSQFGILLEIVGFFMFAAEPLYNLFTEGWHGRAEAKFRSRHVVLGPDKVDPAAERADLQRFYFRLTLTEVVGALLVVGGLVLQLF